MSQCEVSYRVVQGQARASSQEHSHGTTTWYSTLWTRTWPRQQKGGCFRQRKGGGNWLCKTWVGPPHTWRLHTHVSTGKLCILSRLIELSEILREAEMKTSAVLGFQPYSTNHVQHHVPVKPNYLLWTWLAPWTSVQASGWGDCWTSRRREEAGKYSSQPSDEERPERQASLLAGLKRSCRGILEKWR